MRTHVARRLVRLNRAFYARFARDFADTRAVLPPGVRRVLARLADRPSLLDLGCGDGRIARALATGAPANRIRRYCGVDASTELVAEGRRRAPALPAGFRFVIADLAAPGWSDHPALRRRPRFAAAVCLAALFHIPGARRRLRLLRELRCLLAPDGLAAISAWQFLHVPRLRRRVVPWAEVGIAQGDVDRGDLLVDWRRGGRGLRYVHHFAPGELAALARAAGFMIIDSFASDGATGDMSLYLILGIRGPSATRRRALQ